MKITNDIVSNKNVLLFLNTNSLHSAVLKINEEICEFTQSTMYNVREIVAMGLSKTHNKTIKIFLFKPKHSRL